MFWNLDNDVLAGEIGEYIEKMDIDGIKVIKYEGDFSPYGMRKEETDNPNLLTMSVYDKADLFNDDIKSPRSIKILNEHRDIFKNYKNLEKLRYYDLLRDIDGTYWLNVGIPWEKEQMKKYSAKFAIELHSTPDDNMSNRVIFSTSRLNGKMRSLLKEYERDIFNRLPNNPIAKETAPSTTNTKIQIHIDNVGFYHMFAIEAMHNLGSFNISDEKRDLIDNYSEIVKDISQFFRQEYLQLWKKN